MIFDFLNSLFSAIPDIIFALLLLLVAFVAAKLAQSAVTKLLKTIRPEKFFEKLKIKDANPGKMIEFIAKLTYFVVFLLFLPGVLDNLGMHSVSSPISSMAATFLAFIPTLIGAALILAVGLFVAKLVKQLLIPIFKTLKLDMLQEKAGIQTTESTALSSILGNFVYAVILLIVIAAALEQLGIDAISQPANAIVTAILGAIPYVFYAIIVIAAGLFIGKTVGRLLSSLLAGIGTDKLTEKLHLNAKKPFSLSAVIGETVKYVLDVIFIVQGVNVLDLPVLTEVGSTVIGYLPLVLFAVILGLIGVFAARSAEAAILGKFPTAKAAAFSVKLIIYVITVFLCLSQLGISVFIAEKTFLLIVTALCVAFAIAFGVGGRQFAADMLAKLEQKLENKEADN